MIHGSTTQTKITGDRAPPGKRDRSLFLFVHSHEHLYIMPNLTKLEDKSKPWDVPNYQHFPVHEHQGVVYRLVPEAVLSRMANQKENIFWLSIGAAAVAVAAVTSLIMGAMHPSANASSPMIIEKPVIVDREKVVPTNCFAFCK